MMKLCLLHCGYSWSYLPKRPPAFDTYPQEGPETLSRRRQQILRGPKYAHCKASFVQTLSRLAHRVLQLAHPTGASECVEPQQLGSVDAHSGRVAFLRDLTCIHESMCPVFHREQQPIPVSLPG